MSNTTDFSFGDSDLPANPFKEEEKVPEIKVKEDVEPTQDVEVEEHEATFLAIYDAVLFEGAYEKMVKLGRKHSIVLRTRDADADMTVARKLDSYNYKTVSAYQSMASILTLSYSLVEVDGVSLRDMSSANRYEYIMAKPSAFIELISNKMVDFDNEVREALTFGEANF